MVTLNLFYKRSVTKTKFAIHDLRNPITKLDSMAQVYFLMKCTKHSNYSAIAQVEVV